MIFKKASLILVALLLGVMVVACGDDDDDADPTATEPPAAAEATATTATDDAEATEEDEATATEEDAVTPTEEAAATATEELADPTATEAEADETPTEATGAGSGTAEADATESDTEPTADATAGDVTEDEAALFEMALTEEDLPSGWTLTSSSAVTDDEVSLTFCNAEPYQSPEGRIAAIEQEFEMSPTTGPFLLQNLTAYPEEVAIEAAEYARGIIAECDEWTDEDGVTYQLSDLELPDLGDETFGMTMTFEVPGIGEVPTDFAFVRVGGVLISLGYISIDEGDDFDFEAVLEQAVEKVEESGYQPQ